MDTLIRSNPFPCAACAIGILLLTLIFPARAFSDEKPEIKSPATDSHITPNDEPVDVRTLVLREQRNTPGNDRGTGKSVLSLFSKEDGTVEVRDTEGKLLEEYPPNYFNILGKVNDEAIARMNAAMEAKKAALEERKAVEQEEMEKEREAAREAEERKQQEEADREAQWKADFAAKSNEYLDRSTRTKLKAVKIDAREIRDDGTFVYEGRALKPDRLWNTQRNRYEMAIPVPPPAE